MKTISTIKTAFTGVPIALLACLLTFSWSTAEAGGACENSSQWPTSTQTISGLDPIQLTTCAYAGDYTVVDGITAGRTYEFTSSDATTYITVREDAVGGTVLAAGTGPISVVSGTGGNLYVHYNTDVACGTATTCLTITAQDVTPPCENSTLWPTSTFDVSAGTGVQQVSTCVYAGDYSHLTGIVSGNYYEINVNNGVLITVREGAVGGTVIATGTSIVAFTAASASDIYVHYNTDASCGTNSTCNTITVEDQGLPPCENTSSFGSATASAVDGETVLISGALYNGSEVSTVDGIQNGYEYQITHENGSFITVRSGAANGAVLAAGFSPLNFSGGADGTVYIHWTADAACTQDASGSWDGNITSIGFPICENSSQWPSGSVTVGAAGAGAVDISTNQYSSGEYSVLTGITASAEYVLTHGNGVFITVREGAVDGPVVGSGFSPLTIATTSTDDLYVHWNEDQGCNIDESGSFTTTVENLGVACVVDAGTITADEATVCLQGGSASITATSGGDQVVPTGWEIAYVLTDESDPSLPIVDLQPTPTFTVSSIGDYRVHTLIYDPADAGTITAETTGTGVAALLIENGGALCGSLDVTGSSVSVVDCPDNDDCDNAEPIACGDALAGSTVNGSLDPTVTSAGIGVWYTFEGNGQDVTFSTCGAADFDTEITVQTGADCASLTTLSSNDDFTGCADNTSELTIYAEFGTTYYIHVGHWSNFSTITGTFTLSATCVCPDAASLSAGTLTANSDAACLDENGEAVLSASENDAPVVPAGYEALYVLTSGGTDYVIEQTNAVEPTFTVSASGVYTLHTLVYSSTTLDLGVVVPGTTTAADVLGIVTAEDSICAALDVTGATVTVTGAGTLIADESQVCVGETISASEVDAPVIPFGYAVLYVLTDADDNLTIIDADASPSFAADSSGSFVIHSFVYNPADIPDPTTLIGTEALAANALLVQGGGTVCAALDLTGAAVDVVDCPANDLCGQAIAIACTDVVTGSTEFATNTDELDNVPGAGLWYVFTGNGDDVTVSTDNAGTDYDTRIGYTDGCGNAGIDFDEDGGDVYVNGWTSVLTFPTVQGTDYYVYVGGYQGTSTGNFELSVTCTTPPVAPDNDDVCSATGIGFGPNGPFTNVAATADVTDPIVDAATDGCSGDDGWCFDTDVENSVWFTFVAPASGRAIVSTDGSTFDTQLAVYEVVSCQDFASGTQVELSANDDDPAGGTTSAVTLCALTPGETYYVLVDGYGGAEGDITVTLTEVTLDADFTSVDAGLEVTFTDASASSGTITDWAWDFGDGNTSIMEDPVHTYTADGTYTVCLTVTDENGCTSTVCNPVQVADITISIAETVDRTMNVYPNPSNGQFVVEINGVEADVQLNVLDLAGRVVYTEGAVLNRSFRKEVNINAATGTYLLQIVTEEGTVTRKLLID